MDRQDKIDLIAARLQRRIREARPGAGIPISRWAAEEVVRIEEEMKGTDK